MRGMLYTFILNKMIEMIRDRKEGTSLINDDDLNHAWDYGLTIYNILRST